MVARKRSRKKASTTIVTEGTKKVMVQPFKGAETDEITEIEILPFETDPAYVRVSAGQTVNLGDYESLRVDVAITMPCYKEQVEETQKHCADWVADKMGKEIDKYLGEDEED